MKILTKWRNFKVTKAKNNKDLGLGGFNNDMGDDMDDQRQKPTTENKLYQESANDRQNPAYGGNHPELSEQLEPYENNSGSYGTEQNQQRMKQMRV